MRRTSRNSTELKLGDLSRFSLVKVAVSDPLAFSSALGFSSTTVTTGSFFTQFLLTSPFLPAPPPLEPGTFLLGPFLPTDKFWGSHLTGWLPRSFSSAGNISSNLSIRFSHTFPMDLLLPPASSSTLLPLCLESLGGVESVVKSKGFGEWAGEEPVEEIMTSLSLSAVSDCRWLPVSPFTEGVSPFCVLALVLSFSELGNFFWAALASLVIFRRRSITERLNCKWEGVEAPTLLLAKDGATVPLPATKDFGPN